MWVATIPSMVGVVCRVRRSDHRRRHPRPHHPQRPPHQPQRRVPAQAGRRRGAGVAAGAASARPRFPQAPPKGRRFVSFVASTARRPLGPAHGKPGRPHPTTTLTGNPNPSDAPSRPAGNDPSDWPTSYRNRWPETDRNGWPDLNRNPWPDPAESASGRRGRCGSASRAGR